MHVSLNDTSGFGVTLHLLAQAGYPSLSVKLVKLAGRVAARWRHGGGGVAGVVAGTLPGPPLHAGTLQGARLHALHLPLQLLLQALSSCCRHLPLEVVL